MRDFLARLARQVRQGRIEVHAYSLLTTHYHLLVRSPVGRMSEALRRVQGEYSRRFNRQRRRDGSLVRGRFHSRRVDTDAYLRAVVRYVDANAVRAGLVRTPGEHEFGSAAAYLNGRGPRWLNRGYLAPLACDLVAAPRFSAEIYRRAFDWEANADLAAACEMVEAGWAVRRRAPRDQVLWKSAPAEVRAWIEWKKRLADGHDTGIPITAPSTLQEALAADQRRNGVWRVEDGRRTWRGEQLCWIALMHDLCCAPWREIAQRAGDSVSRVRRSYLTHQRLYGENPAYAARFDSLCGTLLP